MTEKSYRSLIKMQNQYERTVEQNRQLQQERMRLISDNNFVRAELNQIKLLLEGENTECTIIKKKCEKYKQALDDIEKIMKDVCGNCETQNTKWYSEDCRELF